MCVEKGSILVWEVCQCKHCWDVTAEAWGERGPLWREIHVKNMVPPELVGWTPEDEEELQRIANRDIDMAETNLGRYAALQTAEEECSCS